MRTVIIGDKKIQVKVADTAVSQEKGLMGVSSMPPDEGMLFVFNIELPYAFWMKDTLIPLDIIWLDKKKSIVYIQKNALPCTKSPCTSYMPNNFAQYVLEVNAGWVEKNKIKLGDKVKF